MALTASREDFKLYFTCPRKLALKTMGIKVMEIKRPRRLTPAYAIGVSGEKLTEEMLEIIASLQVDKSKGEYVEVLKDRNEPVKKSVETLVEKLRTIAQTTTTLTEVIRDGMETSKVKENVKRMVRFTVEEAFKKIEGTMPHHEIESYKSMIERQTMESFLDALKGLSESIPKIKTVYKPTLRNRDTCSFGYPDYQVKTIKEDILIEVKNLKDLERAIEEGRWNLLYYNSLLADLELGDSIWRMGKLARPSKSLIVVPRWGEIKEITEPIPNFREIAVEIWKIKRSALIDHVIPDIKPEPSICRWCKYRKFCEKEKIEQLEYAKPIPLIYAIAEYERERCVGGTQSQQYQEKIKMIYRTLPDEFDNWGGLEFLIKNWTKIDDISRKLYRRHEENLEVILRVAKKRWKI